MYKLVLKKGNNYIKSEADWFKYVPPKKNNHWRHEVTIKMLAEYFIAAKGYIPKEIEKFRFNYVNFIDENKGDYVISKKYFIDIKMRIDPDTMRIIEPAKFEKSEYKGFIISLKRPILYISKYNSRVF